MLAELPDPVRRHLEREVLAPALLAWLKVDDEGKVLDHDSSDPVLSRRLDATPRLEDCLPVFVGMLPLAGRELSLRSVVLDGGAPMDVHAFESGGATWVLLVDEGRRGELLRRLLERANREELEQARVAAVTERLIDVVRGLETAVFEPLGGTDARLVCPAPLWLEQAGLRLEVGDRIDVRAISDYAADFLEAQRDRHAPPGRLFVASLPWLEEVEGIGPVARECILGTTAGGYPFFVVRRLGLDLADRVGPIQAGRELGLVHERLANEVEEKEVLLHCLVHDLANPLGNLISTLELLDASLEGDDEELRKTALSEALRQRSIIHALLDIFRVETSSERAARQPVDLRATVERLRPGLVFAGELQDVRIEVDLDEADLRVLAEPLHLERVLQNLVENALRFSPGGTRVRIEAERRGDHVLIRVEDQGPGVPEGTRHELFEKLRSGPGAGGKLGLGLYFCKITLERWAGSIRHRNLESGGSQFEIAVPAADPAAGLESSA